ncbi:MAG TPA: glycosyltransferase family 4 protein [Acidimicrobiales bacterium]|nr:glycosyltransferase family 4 protein [Acidimicrobiales bacterium]
MTHLLVTNDFPPKTGGIQSYLWELWRRLPPERTVVLTTPHPDAAAWDGAQPFRVVRTRQRVLLPTSGLLRQIEALRAEVGASVVVLDPALPLGMLGRSLSSGYDIVVHGAEVTVPRRLPLARQLLAKVLTGADHVVAAGPYPEAEARRVAGDFTPPVTVVPPGVDVERFRPLSQEDKAKVRADFGLRSSGPLIVSASRLVPRKGMDVLIEACGRLRESHPDLTLAIAGQGRDRGRLERRAARSGAAVTLLGWVSDDDLPRVHAMADVFAMLCRNRWFGLEQEGFGIVFLEAAACGVPQIAGDSGGAGDAVADGKTGLVVRRPRSVASVTSALLRLLDDDAARTRLGAAARERAVRDFSYDALAARLWASLEARGA